MGKGKTTKTPANPNSERAMVKNLVMSIFNRLNNILIANDQTHRYHIEWNKGTGYLDDGYERTNNYYKLEVYIREDNGDIIHVFGDNQPIPDGYSELRILEAELQAYKNLLLNGVGSLISVQHSTFLIAEANQRNAQIEAEKKDIGNQSNIIL